MSKIIFIQIPAYNEEAMISNVLREIPREIKGFNFVKVLVINDGSTDRTIDVVRQSGVEYILDFKKNRGLGVAFRSGLVYGLDQGAEVIVNLDGDHQYSPTQIEKIIAPILLGHADVVIGDRQLETIAGYPKHRLISQFLGNMFLSLLFITSVRDATSGFRAYSRGAAEFLTKRLTNDYTYTIESLCLLLKVRMRVLYEPIDIHFPTRASRLIKSRRTYVQNFVTTALKMRMKSSR